MARRDGPTAARPEHIRRHNLGLLLRQVHQHGQLSRTDLARASGLNRSTIRALVGDLVDLGLVSEHVPDRTHGAGRPPFLVVGHPRAAYVIAVDVDVDVVTVAAVGLTGSVLGRTTWRHAHATSSPAAVATRVAAAARELDEQLGCGRRVGVAASVPAMVDDSDGKVVHAPNLGWSDEPFGALLSEHLCSSVRVANDADLTAIAELRRGAAASYSDAVCVLGRVGVGAGLLIGGGLLRSGRGYGGEVGHMTVQAEGALCHCGNYGCLEGFIGEAGILRSAHEAGVAVDQLDELYAHVAAGDPAAVAVVQSAATWLGHGLSNLMNLLNPEAFVVSGHLAQLLQAAEAQIRAPMRDGMVTSGRASVDLVQGQVRDAPLLGAAELAFEDLLAAPDLVATGTGVAG